MTTTHINRVLMTVALHDRMRRQYQATGVFLTMKDVETLHRAERTLHRWAERVCGWDTDYASVVLERDEVTNIPYHNVHMFRFNLSSYRVRVDDLEAGALRRVADVCKRNGLDYFHQGDPRGCALYISKAGAGMDDTNYSQFIACDVR